MVLVFGVGWGYKKIIIYSILTGGDCFCGYIVSMYAAGNQLVLIRWISVVCDQRERFEEIKGACRFWCVPFCLGKKVRIISTAT